MSCLFLCHAATIIRYGDSQQVRSSVDGCGDSDKRCSRSRGIFRYIQYI